MTAKFALFMQLSEIAYQSEQLLYNKFSDLMLTLEIDKMTALQPKNSLTFFFYIQDNISQWLTIKGIFDNIGQ